MRCTPVDPAEVSDSEVKECLNDQYLQKWRKELSIFGYTSSSAFVMAKYSHSLATAKQGDLQDLHYLQRKECVMYVISWKTRSTY